jgi:hypothetical protein
MPWLRLELVTFCVHPRVLPLDSMFDVFLVVMLLISELENLILTPEVWSGKFKVFLVTSMDHLVIVVLLQ